MRMQSPVAGEKPFRVGVAFLFAKSAGFHHLAKNPALHDRDALAAGFQKADVVGDHENGNSSFPVDFKQQTKDLVLKPDIERGDGFVANKQLRPHKKSSCNCHPLTLSIRRRTADPGSSLKFRRRRSSPSQGNFWHSESPDESPRSFPLGNARGFCTKEYTCVRRRKELSVRAFRWPPPNSRSSTNEPCSPPLSPNPPFHGILVPQNKLEFVN